MHGSLAYKGRMSAHRSSAALFAASLVGLFACGARTALVSAAAAEPDAGVDAPPPPDSAPLDVLTEATADGGAPDDGTVTDVNVGPDADAAPDGSCTIGTVVGDVFGSIVTFASGASLPAGRYRLTYVDGCMLYGGGQGWTVNAYALGDPAGSDHWWIMSGGHPITTAIPPGTVGILPGQGAFATFDACVQANLQLAPVDVVLPAGPVGVWLEDDPYSDNVAGPSGRAPTWSLQCVQ
jgi:hypothetical protein